MLLFLLLLAGTYGSSEDVLVPASKAAKAPYPIWAHYHMVWLRSGHNQSETIQYVKDYLAHNISVGGTDIDSQWATGDNTFVWNATKFPDPKAMVSELHALGVRTILWATSLIDETASNYEFAKQNNYLLNKGDTVKWWHGRGAFLDFTYPKAKAYWKSLMDQVLVDTGVDGFKV